MPAYIIAPALIVALTYWVAWRIDRAEKLIDEQPDGDCRTAALAQIINEGE